MTKKGRLSRFTIDAPKYWMLRWFLEVFEKWYNLPILMNVKGDPHHPRKAFPINIQTYPEKVNEEVKQVSQHLWVKAH